MPGTVLLVLTEGFQDMALISNQVILEESNNDVIIASRSNSAIKGQESSVMTVSLQEAMEQDMEYAALLIIGGNSISGWSELHQVVTQFQSRSAILAAVSSGIDVLVEAGITEEVSHDGTIKQSGQVITLKDIDNVESFSELLASLI